MDHTPFYAKGLHFSCTRCSACCRYESGFVFLSKKDLDALAGALQLSYSEFQQVYCRWIPVGDGNEQLSLKEKANYDCIFWENGCTVYDNRPLQCRTFPFWSSTIRSQEAWDSMSMECPGIDRGRLFTGEEIVAMLNLRASEPIIVRKHS